MHSVGCSDNKCLLNMFVAFYIFPVFTWHFAKQGRNKNDPLKVFLHKILYIHMCKPCSRYESGLFQDHYHHNLSAWLTVRQANIYSFLKSLNMYVEQTKTVGFLQLFHNDRPIQSIQIRSLSTMYEPTKNSDCRCFRMSNYIC